MATRDRGPGLSTVLKRSVSIRGHPTSFSVEQPFYDELSRMAASRGITVALLVGEIDDMRGRDSNLSSAVRVAVLAWVKGNRGEEPDTQAS